MTDESTYLGSTILTGIGLTWTLLQYVSPSGLSDGKSTLLLTVILLLPVFLVSHAKWTGLRKMRLRNCKPAPVYPHVEPFLGLDWPVAMSKAFKKNRLLEFWEDLFQTVGSTYWAQNTGSWVLNTTEPENIKAVLSTDFDIWVLGGMRQKVAALAAGSHSIFAVNGQAWKDARTLIRPSFTRSHVADLAQTDEHVERFLAKIPDDGSSVELQALFLKFMTDVSTDFLFGYSTKLLDDPSQEAIDFSRSFDFMVVGIIQRARLGWLSLFVRNKKLDQAMHTVKSFADRFILRALEHGGSKSQPHVFMKEMIEADAQVDNIRDQLMGMLLAGRDTSAAALTFTFWCISRRPDVLAKIQEEVAHLGGRKPTWEDVRDLKYLNMVLSETIRLWPPVPTQSRYADRDTVLPRGGGPEGKDPVFVPKGTTCSWSMHSLHRRRDIYGDDAGEFRPERWESMQSRDWEYVPFSGGPRICIGQEFARIQMAYMLARMVQTFPVVEAGDDLPMEERIASTRKLVNGCQVRLSRC